MRVKVTNPDLGIETDQEFEVSNEVTITYVNIVHPLHGEIMLYKNDTEEVEGSDDAS